MAVRKILKKGGKNLYPRYGNVTFSIEEHSLGQYPPGFSLLMVFE
jgi:hypothetical protein